MPRLKRADRRAPSPTNIPASELPQREALSLCARTHLVSEVLDLSRHPDPIVRQRALREMCPCRVKDDLSEFWERVLAMRKDESALVRKQVRAMHVT